MTAATTKPRGGCAQRNMTGLPVSTAMRTEIARGMDDYRAGRLLSFRAANQLATWVTAERNATRNRCSRGVPIFMLLSSVSRFIRAPSPVGVLYDSGRG